MIFAGILLALPTALWWVCLALFLQRWWLLTALWGVPAGAAAGALTAVAVLAGWAGRPRVTTPEVATRMVVAQLPEPAPLDFAWPVYFYWQWYHDLAEITRLVRHGTVLTWRTGWELIPRWPDLIHRDELRAPRTRRTAVTLLGPVLAFPAAFLLGATAGAAAAVVLVIAVAVALCLAYLLFLGLVVGPMAAWAKAGSRRYRTHAYCTRCFHRADLPAYACPGPHPDATGTGLHRRLRPGILGIWWHRCGCGSSLPATPRRAARRLTPICPACRTPLPAGAGWSRDVRIAVFGGPRTGKTALLDATVRGLTSPRSTPPASLGPLPAASPTVTLLFPGTRRPSLVHLFDSPGEDLLDPRRRRRLTYLDDASSLILTVDPLSIAGVRTAFDQVPAERRPAVEPGEDEPDDTYRAMVEALRFHGAGSPKRLAVVVTKYDALAVLDGERMAPDSDAVREWLRRHGLGAMVFAAARDFRPVRYFRTSLDGSDGIGDPLAWILREEGVTAGSRHG